MYDQLHRENNRTRLSKNWNEGTQSGGKLWSQFQNEIHNTSRKWVDFLATLSMNDFIPKSWVWIRCRKPNCSSFSPGKTDGNWLLVEKMWREIDMYRPMRGTRPFAFQAFPRWAKGPCLWYIQDKRKSFSFPMERVLALPFLHQFSPKAGRNSLLARDVISFVRRVRLGLIVILEVAMVGRYSVRNIVEIVSSGLV